MISLAHMGLLAASSAFLAWLIATEDGPAHIFIRFRSWLVMRDVGWIAELFDCPYCLSAWVLVILLPFPIAALQIITAALGAYVLVGLLERLRHDN